MLSCNCLNVIIVPEIDDFQKVTLDTLQLSDIEKIDPFFNQEIQRLEKLSKVIKKIPALITTRQIGSRWIVHHCINCNMHTHAVHHDNGTSHVLVSKKLLGTEAITGIICSKQYSPAFDIKIMDLGTIELEKSQPMLTTDMDTLINSLRQKVNEFINKETVAMEDRIKKFTEDQYKALEEYREKVLKEHSLLKLKILNHKLNILSHSQTGTNVNTSSYQSNIKTPVQIIADVSRTNATLVDKSMSPINNVSPIVERSYEIESDLSANSPVQRQDHWTVDAEVFFPLEDMQDESALEHSDFEDSDLEDFSKDDSGEPIKQQRQRQQPIQLAKSLPVNIPVFMSSLQNHISEDNDNELPDESMDIAASMKALAKSIQGGTVFGELPRPRFSSQI